MKLIIVTVVQLVLAAQIGLISTGKIADVLSTAVGVKQGVISSVGNVIPSVDGLLESGKNVLAGYPLEAASKLINTVCSTAVSANTVSSRYTPDIDAMQFIFITPCKNYSYPLKEASEIWKNKAFDTNKKVLVFATGWSNTVNESVPLWNMWKAYICRNDVNFIIVDAAAFVDTLYTWSALNTEDIGKHIAKGLVQLADVVPLENIHLMGHSLGAHIVGAAGREFTLLTKGSLIPRITGLDPAKPCFNEGESLGGLLRGDAEFVDIIHSNPGVLGKRDPIGDIDFYPGGLDPLPPGCLSITCAHSRAVEFFAETVYPGNEMNMMAVRCLSLTDLRNDKCKGKSIPMGFSVPKGAKGNYFLEINKAKPYGKSITITSDASESTCHECKH